MSRVIDAHHHLWSYNEAEFGWINEAMGAIRGDFTVEELEPTLDSAGVEGSLVVQARQTLDETDWLLRVAGTTQKIVGVVGWVPLRLPEVADTIADRLPGGSDRGYLVGVRHVVQDEPDPDFLLGAAFNRGIECVTRHDLAYDILVFEHQLSRVVDFVDRHPNQRFVIDHMAKPRVADGLIEPWKTHIAALAERDNVYCKVSGIVTEAASADWNLDMLSPYLDQVFERFGVNRLMFGSDWPVCLVASSYQRWFDLVQQYCRSLSSTERAAVMGDTATAVYQLEEQ